MSKRKQHLVETALRLFMAEGFHTVGIDRILDESGVAKMTLYKHFPSKQALILEALALRDQQFFQQLKQFADAFPIQHGERIAAIFKWHQAWIASDTFRGCAFISAAVAFPAAQAMAHQFAARHKVELEAYIRASLPADISSATASHLMLLLEGAVVLGLIHGDCRHIGEAIRAAEGVLSAVAPSGLLVG